MRRDEAGEPGERGMREVGGEIAPDPRQQVEVARLAVAAAVGHAGIGDFFLRADGSLDRRGTAPAADFVYAGAGVIDPAAVAAFPGEVFSLNPVWDALRAEGRLRGIVYPGGWVDVGRPEGIALAEEELAR